jgi:hypothetical protein
MNRHMNGQQAAGAQCVLCNGCFAVLLCAVVCAALGRSGLLTLRPGECTTVNYKSIGPRVCHASSAAWLEN